MNTEREQKVSPPPPQRWKQARIEDIASSAKNSIVGGPFGSDLVSSDYVELGVPVIRGQNMGQKWLRGPYAYVSPKKAASLEANLARPKDVVVTQRGTLGQVTLVPDGPYPHYLISQSQMKATPDPRIFEPMFLYHVLTSKPLQAQIANETIQTGLPHINLGILKRLTVPFPTLAEQQLVVDVLEDVDGLLTQLDQLIAKKQAVKQGAMQQLLTGQTRLAGFKKQWQPRRLRDVGTWFSGGTPRQSVTALWEGDIPWVSPKDMKTTRLHDAIDHVSKSAIGQGTRLVQKGTILIVVRGMILAHSLPVARAERDLAFNQDIKALVVGSDHDSDFMLWKLLQMKSELMGVITESTHGTKRLSSEALFEVEVLLPALDEQRAIAEVLTDMDDELEALKARRDKTQALKQGMMQELLSGRIRLV